MMARKPMFSVSPDGLVAVVLLAILTAEPVATRNHVSVVPSVPHVFPPPPVVVLVEEQVFTLVSPVRLIVPSDTGEVQVLLISAATAKLTTTDSGSDAASVRAGSARTRTAA